MSIVCESDLLCAASYLCNAADNLRSLGLFQLAAEIDSFIAMLDAEILLHTVGDDFEQAGERTTPSATKP